MKRIPTLIGNTAILELLQALIESDQLFKGEKKQMYDAEVKVPLTPVLRVVILSPVFITSSIKVR